MHIKLDNPSKNSMHNLKQHLTVSSLVNKIKYPCTKDFAISKQLHTILSCLLVQRHPSAPDEYEDDCFPLEFHSFSLGTD